MPPPRARPPRGARGHRGDHRPGRGRPPRGHTSAVRAAAPGASALRLPDPGARGAPSPDTSRGAQGPGCRDAGSERAGGRGPPRGPPTLYRARLPPRPRPDSRDQREALRPRGWRVGGGRGRGAGAESEAPGWGGGAGCRGGMEGRRVGRRGAGVGEWAEAGAVDGRDVREKEGGHQDERGAREGG